MSVHYVTTREDVTGSRSACAWQSAAAVITQASYGSRWTLLAVVALVCASGKTAGSDAGNMPGSQSRRSFSRNIKHIHIAEPGDPSDLGASEAQVIALLGRPDDVVTLADAPSDPTGDAGFRFSRNGLSDGERLLRYGSEGHMTFPTLGEVRVNNEGRVVGVSGSWGNPSPKLFRSEAKLRHFLRLMDRITAPDAIDSPDHWDPLPLIAAVNELSQLAEPDLFAVLEEFARVTALTTGAIPYFPMRDTSVFAVIAVMSVNGSDPRLYGWCNRIYVVDGVPFLLPAHDTQGREGLVPNDLESVHCGWKRKMGRLHPPDDVVSTLKRIDLAPIAMATGLERRRLEHLQRTQLLRLVASAYRPSPGLELIRTLRDEELDRRWAKIRAEIHTAGLRWDGRRGRYVIAPI